MFNKERVDNTMQVITGIGIGSISLGVRYVYNIMKGGTFKLGQFVAYLFIGGFVGYITDSFLPPEWGFRGAIIGITSFLGFQILEFIDKNGLKILVQKFINTPGGNKIDLSVDDKKDEKQPDVNNI